MWLNPDAAETAAIAEFGTYSDRALAIVGAAMLEGRLLQLLKFKLHDLKLKNGETLQDRMFRNAGPLGTFSARINLAYMLQLFDEPTWKELVLIKDMRNEFAHEVAIGSFQEMSIRDRCANLKACEDFFGEYVPGSQSTMDIDTVSPVPGVMPTIKIYVKGLADRLKNPRERYLLSIMYHAQLLKIPLLFRWGVPAKQPSKDP